MTAEVLKSKWEAAGGRMDDVEDSGVTVRQEPCECSKEVVTNNLLMSDQVRDVAYMAGAVMAWLRTNEGKTLADLDVEMRALGMDTQLIAAHYTQIPQFKLHVESGVAKAEKLDGTRTEYVQWISCRPRAAALLEMLTYRASEEENRELLKQAGAMVAEDTSAIPGEDRLDDPTKKTTNSIADGTIRLVKTTLGKIFDADLAKHKGVITLVAMRGRSHILGAIANKDGQKTLVSAVGIQCDPDGSKKFILMM